MNLWRRIAGATPVRWSFWRFNWLANHKVIAAVGRTRHHAHGVMLDVGCGSMRARAWYAGRITRYLGVDLAVSPYLEDARLTAVARAEALPFRAASVDTVLGISMLTCLPEPGRMLDEARRVLRPGGTLILEFTQMAPLHDEPHDYFRFTRYGARELLGRAGFEIVECVPIGGLGARVGLSAIAALHRINRGWTRVLTEIPVRVLYIALQLGFELVDLVFFDPREVLAHLVVARRAEDRGPNAGAGPAPPAQNLDAPRAGR